MNRFIFTKRIVTAMIFLSAISLSAMAQGPLFSNYGYQNLSYATGVSNDVDVYRLETAVDGNVIHLFWIDDYQVANNQYQMWYRRSNDLGLTWEDPVDLNKLTGAYVWQSNGGGNKYMSASNGRVHIFARNESEGLYDLISTDGKTFTKKLLLETTASPNSAFIQAVDKKVAIAYEVGYSGNLNIHIAYSDDNGETFSDSIVSCIGDSNLMFGEGRYDASLHSFSFDGNTMTALARWQDRWSRDQLTWAISSSDGKTFNTVQIATEIPTEEGSIYHGCSFLYRSYNANEPYADIAINGNQIYALIREQLSSEDEKWYLSLHRSVDGGKTWLPAQQICTDKYKPENQRCYIKVNGDDVYILTEVSNYGQYEIRNLIFHSHDAGETFECQTDWTETIHKRGHIADYSLCFDRSDNTGRTIYLAGNDYSWVKTTDGFKTIGEVSLNDGSCPDDVGFWGNLFTNLEIDNNGVKHWFIRYRPNNAKRHEIIYRREVAEPAPGEKDKAFVVAPYTEQGFVRNRVLIPNNINFHGTAITMEMWVKVAHCDGSNTFAYLSHSSGQSTSDGFYLGTRKQYYSEDRYFEAGFCNDKDDNINLRSSLVPFVNDRWYHLALTYDEEARKACFYVNGVLAAEQEFNGTIGWGWNPIIIGNDYYSSSLSYSVDDFRLWNRALSEEEIRENLKKNITTAEGLKVNLRFDDTLLDLSGNGNDGYGMADVDFVDSDIDIPEVDFDVCVTETGDVVVSNHSVGTDTYLWNFGDGKTSALAQPTHTYSKPGEYKVSLEACNATTFTSAAKYVTVAGLSDIQPRNIGDTGKVLATITGGGINKNQSISLTRDGKEIKADEVWEAQPGILKAWFEVENAEHGKWTLNVGNETLENAVTIEETREAKPWMEFKGRGKILFNKWLTHTISYGNKGNVDAYNVPLNFLISHYPDLEVEMIDFEYMLPDLTDIVPEDSFDVVYETLRKDIGDYIIVKDDNGKEWRFYPFQIPVVKAGSSQDIHLRLKTSGDLQIQYWSDEGWGQLDEDAQVKAIRNYIRNGAKAAPSKADQASCLLENIGMGVLDAAIDIIPFGGCAWGAAKTIYGACKDDPKDKLYNLAWNLGTTGLSCLTGGLSSIGKIGYIAATSIGMGASAFGALAGGARCTGGPPNSSSLRAVTSWDPNEMIGPSQFMTEDSVHWIANDRNLSYNILFENKKEATAPAHTVFVTDTLDLTKMDADDFAFTSVGWGDTIVSVPGEQRSEFSVDVDMRPAKPYLVRVSGKFYKETGVVNWQFVTINPETLDEEEDPEIGFLPPNDDNHAGEGFVSFIIGQKADLPTGTKIENMASITFDANKPILTNNFVNGIDNDIPSSAAYLVSDYDSDHLLVQWSGSDASSGVAWYGVYVSTDDEVYKPVKEMFDGESTIVEKTPDTKYYFYTVVTDHVGLSEKKSGTYDVMYDPAVSINTPRADLTLSPKGEKTYEVLLPADAKNATMKVFSTDGRELQSQSLGNGSRFSVSLQSAGAHILVINADGRQYVWKVASVQ